MAVGGQAVHPPEPRGIAAVERGGVSMSLAAAMPRCERRGGGSAGFALKANGANGGSAFKYRTRKSPEGVAGIARFLIGYICCLPDTSEERQDSVYKVAT